MDAPATDETDIVSLVLRQPQHTASLTLAGWDVLVRQARRAGLQARIGCVLDAQGALEVAVPEAPRAHLKAAMLFAEAQQSQARRGLGLVASALDSAGVQPVLLGGAAYVAAGLLPAMGRMSTGLDILVPKSRLPEVEAALASHAWTAAYMSPTDPRGGCRWTLAPTPLGPTQHATVLHVRTAILPDTARLKPSTAKLLAAARPLATDPRFAVLEDADMVLHGMVHLFHNDELSHSLRDLSDLDLLLRHLGRQPGFWAGLLARAEELDLARPLYYGLRYTQRLLATPVPQSTLAAAAQSGPRAWVGALSDALWTRALRPQHATVVDAWTPLALFALHVRAHWLRMPPLMLLRHLTVKALRPHEATAPAKA